jgi:methylenetetrahydrofolate reductase (NADPH)
MKITEHLKSSKDTLFSIEILPPLKGKSIQSIFDGIDPLMEFKPAFVDVTYHREEYIYKKREGGYLEKVSIRKRPGTVGICAAIMNRYDVEAVPHIICGGFTREETENALIDLQFLGIDNVLVLTQTHTDGNNYVTSDTFRINANSSSKYVYTGDIISN